MRVGNKKEMRKASAILTADWHLRDTQPKCRTDDYYEAQWKKVKFIRELQIEHDCPVLVAGDIFDKPKPSPMLLAAALHFLPRNIICIPGQHDLPEHNLDNLSKSGLAVLEEGSDLSIIRKGRSPLPNIWNSSIYGFPWGVEIKDNEHQKKSMDIALIHTLIQEPKKTISSIPYDEDCFSIFKKLSGYNLIVSGDNHKPFFARETASKALLVNPGSLMRMDADQVDHKPRVYLWYAEDNAVEAVYLPIEQGVVSREHIERQTKEDERMEAYKTRLKAGVKIGISFEKNMKRYLLKNKVKPSVEREIYAAMEGGKK